MPPVAGNGVLNARAADVSTDRDIRPAWRAQGRLQLNTRTDRQRPATRIGEAVADNLQMRFGSERPRRGPVSQHRDAAAGLLDVVAGDQQVELTVLVRAHVQIDAVAITADRDAAVDGVARDRAGDLSGDSGATTKDRVVDRLEVGVQHRRVVHSVERHIRCAARINKHRRRISIERAGRDAAVDGRTTIVGINLECVGVDEAAVIEHAVIDCQRGGIDGRVGRPLKL